MADIDQIYSFVFRGLLVDARLDANGRKKNKILNATEIQELRRSLNFDLLDQEILTDAQRMSHVYIAIHALENMIRSYVSKTLFDEYGESWWEKVPEKIQKIVAARMSEDEKLRWHSSRGKSEIMYSDFGDLQSIVYANWPLFSDTLLSHEWMKQVLTTLEKSRNVVMHGGVLDRIDIERIGINIRDWLRQVE
ncbi:MAG: hypothetical protein H6672_16620 [Anaerolineaceae bacterium]|nr:hypothetical protein [Anaerolineaceae bacterium]